MSFHDIIYSPDTAICQFLLEFDKIGFKYLKDHVVDVVFGEVMHSMTECKSLLLDAMDVKLLGRLVKEPNFFEVTLDVFAEEEMSEDQLVLSDLFMR